MKIRSFVRLIFLISVVSIIYSCSKESGGGGGSETGVGGSTARFVVVDDYLYTVDYKSFKIFRINNPNDIQYVKSISAFSELETVFVKDSTLFIGSREGMYIYDISHPENPVYLSKYQHIYSCDPVVADDKYAYVTLRSDFNRCGRTQNRLDIIDITDLKNLSLVKSYEMTNPGGLGLDSNLIFICDLGLKVYDVSNVLDLKYITSFNIEANDVIPLDSVLLVTADDGLYQYQYKNNTISLLSKISITK
jgi:hypothetical protein